MWSIEKMHWFDFFPAYSYEYVDENDMQQTVILANA